MNFNQQNARMSTEAATEINMLAQQLSQLKNSSILLTGSAARDELAEGVIAGRREVFSDYEFFVVTPKRIPTAKQVEIRAQIDLFVHQFSYQNSLFHVDIAFHAKNRLAKLPQSIFTFELKENAQHLLGEEIRAKIPQVTLASLRKKELNTILYRRLWALMLYLPADFVTQRGHLDSPLKEATASYLLARNLLDISTVLVPRQGVLLPTYEERITWWSQQGLSEENKHLGLSFLQDLRTWFEERSSLNFTIQARQRYSQWTKYMESALQIVGLNTKTPHASTSPFNERPLTRGQWLRLAQALLFISKRHGSTTAINWYRRPQKAIRATAHLQMHQSLSFYLQGHERQAQELLLQSWQWLPKLFPGASPQPPTGNYPQTWLKARQYWRDYQTYLLRNRS